MQYWGALRLLERGSAEEANVERTLNARIRILADSHRLVARLAVPVAGWEAVREGLEKSKWYRQLLGASMGSEGDGKQGSLETCLEEIIKAWPDTKSVKAPKDDSAESGKGKKGKGKGKQPSWTKPSNTIA